MLERKPNKVIKNGHDWCSRWYVEYEETMYDSYYDMDECYITRIYVYPNGESNIVQQLKKVWKHYQKLGYKKMKEFNFHLDVSVRAFIESEEGEVSRPDIYWVNQQLEVMEELDLLKDEFPFM